MTFQGFPMVLEWFSNGFVAFPTHFQVPVVTKGVSSMASPPCVSCQDQMKRNRTSDSINPYHDIDIMIIYLSIYLSVCLSVCLYTHICACIYVYIYTHMYIHTYEHIHYSHAIVDANLHRAIVASRRLASVLEQHHLMIGKPST